MQPPTAPPRDTMTQAEVVALIQDSAAVSVSAGCELVDMALNVVDDISDELVGGSVSRASYATLHGTADLRISRELAWGSAIVRPFITLSADAVGARFNLGAYFTSTPARSLQEVPVTYDVQCYDILLALDDPVGDAYAVAAGTSYLTEVEAILLARGITAYTIDQISAGTVLPTDRVWVFHERTTWLTIVNDLLASIGYAGIWSDWDGRLRCAPYTNPRERAPEWTYDTGELTSMLAPDRSVERDFFGSPNRWVFYRSNAIDGDPPEEGDGIYTAVNQSTGDTSIDARGRTVTKVLGLDVADHTSLVAAAQRTIDADMLVATKLIVSSSPNPLHWHFDRALVDDHDMGVPVDVVCTKWTLPLDGSDMAHEWTAL